MLSCLFLGFSSLSLTRATFRPLLSPEFKSIRTHYFSSTSNHLPKFRKLVTELDGSTGCVSLSVTKSFDETCTFGLFAFSPSLTRVFLSQIGADSFSFRVENVSINVGFAVVV